MATAGPSSGSIDWQRQFWRRLSSRRGSTGTRKMASSEGLGTSSQTMKKTIGHRGIDPTGETTYKKTPSSALKGAIQLGITHTVGSLSQKPERDVLMQDFEVVESIFFPREGSNLTPAHRYSDFRFKTYAPIAFRYFREMFGIRPDDFLYSLCNDSLIELSNSGASGSVFYVSGDDEFIIKTVQHKEAEFLQKLLPGYFMNLNQNKRTLLPKFYGLYCIQAGGKNIRLVVMNNLLPCAVPMHLKYDLKGSTYKRRASAKERAKVKPTYKDLDFIQDLPEGLLLETDNYSALCKTIQRDCLLLESFKIMDYSLLVGIHNLEQASRERAVEEATGAPDHKRPQGQKSLYSTAIEAIQGEARGKRSVDPVDHMGGIPAQNSKGERKLLYIGIIDILQSYRFAKKLEHSWKALVHDGDTVSVHRPGFYADRFQRFMCNTVFKKIPSKTSPFKKNRVGTGPRRVNATGCVLSPLDQASGSGTGAQRQLSTETEPEIEPEGVHGIQSGRPDLLPNTPRRKDATTSLLAQSNIPTSTTASNLPNLSSIPSTEEISLSSLNISDLAGVEGNESASSDHNTALSASRSLENVKLEDSVGGENAISLNDIVPHASKCY